MDTQEILPENIEESHLPNSGLDEIEAAMEKISELENTDTDASEKKLEVNPENKTKEINLENPHAKEDSNTEVEEAQAEKTEDEFSALQQKEKPNKLWHEKKLKFKAIAEKEAPYINNLESNINQSGQMQYLYSSEFFDMIDNYIDKVKTPKVSTPPLSSNNVAGVKKSYQGSSTAPPFTKKQIVLTAEEKIMASNAGVSEKDWLKFKIEELNKGK